MIRVNDYKDKCWWCGNIADSKEHKIKKTDFVKIYGRGPYDNDSKILHRGENFFEIKDPKSNVIKFDQCLCTNCNNLRSKDIDAAYSTFIDYVLSNPDLLFETKEIDLKKIFGSAWEKQRDNVLRYYVKHIGCQAATGNYEVSSNIINYLNRKESLKDINFIFELRHYNYQLTNVHAAYKFIYIGPVVFHHKIDNKVLSLTGWYTLNWFTMNFVYEDNVTCSPAGSVFGLSVTDYSSMPRIDEKQYREQVEILETFDKSENLAAMQNFRERLVKSRFA